MVGGHRLFGTFVIAALSATMLTGCLSAQIPDSPDPKVITIESSRPTAEPTKKPTAKPSTKPTATSSAAPDGWESFEPCGHEFGVEWQWIDGYPADEMEDNGMYPVCGELWLASRGAQESLLTTRVDDVSEDTVNAFGESLEVANYVLSHDSFAPDEPADENYYGARVYYLNGDDGRDATGIAIEVYGEDVHNDQFQIYVDYFSPETRANP